MSEILDQLATTIQDVIEAIGYPGITFIIFLENVFPPIPSELVLPFAGFLVHEGDLNFFGVWIASTIGSLLGALALYWIGAWADDHVVRGFIRRYGRWFTISEKDYDRALHFFDRYGNIMVFTGRLIPIVRSIISLPAGADKMPIPKFLLFTALGSMIWNGLLVFAGMQLGENWEDVISFVERYQRVTIVIIAVAVLIFAGFRAKQMLSARNAAPPVTENDTSA